jgi:hypothetical protein
VLNDYAGLEIGDRVEQIASANAALGHIPLEQIVQQEDPMGTAS